MKSVLSFIICLLMCSCATHLGVRTSTDRKIEEHTQRLTDDARDLIATAQHLLDDAANKSNDPKLKQISDIIEKGQALLGAKINDGESIKNLTEDKMQQAIDEIYNQGRDLQELIKRLETKNKDATAKIIADDIGHQAVEKHEFWKSFKMYSMLGAFVLAVIALFVYVPASAVRALMSWMGILKRSDHDEPPRP